MSLSFEKMLARAADASAGIPELSSGVSRLATLGADPVAGLFRVRKMFEYVIYDLFTRRSKEPPGTRSLEDLIQRLVQDEHLPRRFIPSANFIREVGNLGVHHPGEEFTADDVESALALLVPILVWYREQIAESLPPRPDGPTVGRAAIGADHLEDDSHEPPASRIAPPPRGDIGEAIESAIQVLDALALKLGASLEDLGLEEIGAITSEAIRHGAGIYNAGSFLGCARIYHHAARLVIERMTGPFWDPLSPPPMGERLAAEWLARILQANPKPAESDADDLAWELRFAFDSIQDVPLLDAISGALNEARDLDGEPSAEGISDLLKRVLVLSQDIQESSRRAFSFHHTARVLLWIADQSEVSPSSPEAALFRSARQSLGPIVDARARVTRSNAPALAHAFGSALVQIVDPDRPGPDPGGKWYDPRNWFRT